MKLRVETDEGGYVVLTEVFSGLIMETAEGNRVGLCMRDDTVEFNVIPATGGSKWFHINMQEMTVSPLGPAMEAAPDGAPADAEHGREPITKEYQCRSFVKNQL